MLELDHNLTIDKRKVLSIFRQTLVFLIYHYLFLVKKKKESREIFF